MGMEREQTTIRLPVELKQEIQKEAYNEGITFNQYVLIILRNWLNHQN